MNQEKINELLSDEEFISSLLELETAEEVVDALAEKDVAVTVDDLNKIIQLLQKKASGELSDEELEEVAGGSAVVALGLTCAAALVGGIAGMSTGFIRRW